jgi:acid phosphatase class B
VFFMPQLVSFAASHGYAVFFITGRPQTQTDATVNNLVSAGYAKHMASEGYTIMADFGDQYSDLLGGNAGHQVKIPNPMYYIP